MIFRRVIVRNLAQQDCIRQRRYARDIRGMSRQKDALDLSFRLDSAPALQIVSIDEALRMGVQMRFRLFDGEDLSSAIGFGFSQTGLQIFQSRRFSLFPQVVPTASDPASPAESRIFIAAVFSQYSPLLPFCYHECNGLSHVSENKVGIDLRRFPPR